MLDLAGIPRRAANRNRQHPIVIAGGPCTSNPEPVAPFFDAVVVGDGEQVILQLAHRWMEWKNSGAEDKDSLLDRWSKIQGHRNPTRTRRSRQRRFRR